MSRAFHIAPQETKEQRQKRLSDNRKFRQEKSDKLERLRHGGASADVEIANLYIKLGIDYFSLSQEKLYQAVVEKFNKVYVEHIPEAALAILMADFGARIGQATNSLKKLLIFPEEGDKGESRRMKLYSAIAKETGQSSKIVRAVYEALVTEVKHGLKHDRFFRLPDIGRIRIAYRKALPKRKGVVPFTGEKKTFPARPASNKIRFTPAKFLKEYVAAKVKVVAPPEKKKKK